MVKPQRGPGRARLIRRWLAIASLIALLGLAAWLTPLFLRQRTLPAKVRIVVTKVIDGDTLRCIPEGGARQIGEPGRELKVRLCGISSAELGTAESFRVALALAELAEGARETWLEPERNGSGEVAHDKYGRVLGWLWVLPAAEWAGQRRLLTAGKPVDPPRLGTGGLVLVQEELLKLGLTEIYPEARASRYYERLELALR
jgi:endonuclease YncB( thermonuclease family)